MAVVTTQGKNGPPPPPPPAVVTYPGTTFQPPQQIQHAGGLKCVAVAEIVFGVLSIICGGAATGVAASLRLTGLFSASGGCWGGGLLLAAGVAALIYTTQENSANTNVNTVLMVGGLAWAGCAAAFGVSVAAAYYSGLAHGLIISFYYINVAELGATVALNALVAVFMFVGLILAVFHIRFCCAQQQQQPGIIMTTVPGQQQAVPVVVGQNPPGAVTFTNYHTAPYAVPQTVPAPVPAPQYYNQQGTFNQAQATPNVPV